MRVLVVDPSRVIVKVLRAILEREGHEVVTVQDGSEALAFIRSERGIDVLVTGLELPGHSGLELCWAARSHAIAECRPIYIIAMSSDHIDRRLAEVLDSGADEFIRKTRSETELAARLRAAARVNARERELIAMALRDPLTDLYNRRAFYEKATARCQSSGARDTVAAAILDIDHFKSVNDRFGHDVGDKVIRRVARHLQGLPGIVGRIGGEEFALIAPGSDERSILGLGERLRHAVMRDKIDHDGGGLAVTISIGTAVEIGPCHPDVLLKRADVGLYRAKAGGRNRTVFAAAEDDLRMPVPGHSRAPWHQTA